MKAMKNGKIRRSRAEWEELISKYRLSGLSKDGFCEREGVSRSSFGVWHRKLSGKSRGFVELSTPNSSWDIELELPGSVLLRMRRS